MVARKRNYPRRRVAAKTRTRKTAPRRKKSTYGIKKMVRSEIARNIENKTFQFLGTSHDILPSTSPGFDANIIPCYPAPGYLAINNATGQGNRVGNSIKIKNLSIKGTVFSRPYNSVSNPTPSPVQIKFWFFYDKTAPSSVPTPATSADFFQFGNSALGFQNEFFDHKMPINTDRYRVLTTRTVKVGYSSYTGTGAQPQSGNFNNNDFRLNANLSVNLTKHCIKNCKFRDNNALPTSRGIYMVCQPIYADGSAMASSTIPARMEYMMSVVYEDA